MIFYTINTPVKYQTPEGEKTKWLQVGSMNVTEDGQHFITLNINPDVKYMAFKVEPKEKKTKKS